MNKFKIEFILNTGESTEYIIQNNLSFSEIDHNIANLLANTKFITADQSETSILSIKCELVDKYRISIFKD